MEERIIKAHERLKEFEIFSDDFETFKNFFYENLKQDKKDEAIELLLMVVFKSFKSQGEKFNILLGTADKETKEKLIKWLDDSMKRAVK